jgi:hypothetical protein
MWWLEGSKVRLFRPVSASRLEHDRDRPVVHELDRHARAEDPGRDLDAEVAERLREPLVERLGVLGPCRFCERRTVALARVDYARQR